MATPKNRPANLMPRSTGYVISAAGLFMSIAATTAAAAAGHSYAGVLIGVDVLLFTMGVMMVALAFHEHKRERQTDGQLNQRVT
jgi:fatty acid desaturase